VSGNQIIRSIKRFIPEVPMLAKLVLGGLQRLNATYNAAELRICIQPGPG
jgi:hypothetical protein